MSFRKTLITSLFMTISGIAGIALLEIFPIDISAISGQIILLGSVVATAVILSIIYQRLPDSNASQLEQLLSGIADKGQALDSINPENFNDGSQYMVAKHLNKIFADISSDLNRFKQTSNQLAVSASDMATTTEQNLRTITEQQMETEQVATAMNEMTSTVEEVSRNAASASQGTHEVNEHSTHGMQIAEQTLESINTLVSSVNNAAEVIEKLEKESNEIGAILDVIKGIAEQTNLLALNAAIEAARAGEQGRGFAVVADEVRTLAGRTQQSTHEIEEMINRLQSGAHESVTVMKHALENGEKGSEQVVQMRDSLQTITTALASVNDMNTQIATAAEEQTAVANEINQNIINISSLAEQNTEYANKSYQSSEGFARISMQLQEMLNQFSVSSDNTLDLSSAKAAHLNWKTRLRSFLDGQSDLTMDQAVSHHHCDFGKWYYSEGLQKFGSLNAIVEVEAPHAELHDLIKTIIDQKESGDLAAAERSYQQVDLLSSEIVTLLDAAEREAHSQ